MMSASASSSSTTSTSISLIWLAWQREAEPGSLGRGGVQPDAAAEVLDDLAAHGQPDAGARVGAALVEPLEQHEYPLGVLRLDPDAVVGEREDLEPAVGPGGDDDARRGGAAELQRVAEQVLEHRGQQREFRHHQRQASRPPRRTWFLD